jgi:hypothetical protein
LRRLALSKTKKALASHATTGTMPLRIRQARINAPQLESRALTTQDATKHQEQAADRPGRNALPV